ncbi:MAG TPA: DciA family protein [Burkholderiales bacterium]|nr:DciA family protein [Burkholderiales bacterium]
MPVQKIGDVIASSGALAALSRQAQRLRDLQQLLSEALPPALAAASRVKNLKAGTLVIRADHSAAAAKLRQLAPRLLAHIRKRVTEVTGIRVEVQAKAGSREFRSGITSRALPVDAIEDFERLARALPDSPLRSALARLLARRRPGR